MKIIEPSAHIVDEINGKDLLRKIEVCGRVCYRSEDKITEDSAEKFVAMLIKRGHESVLEHANIIIQVDENTANRISQSLINDDVDYPINPICLRHTAVDYRWIFSGNVRAWRDYFRFANPYSIPHELIAFFRQHSFHKLWDDVLGVFAPCKDTGNLKEITEFNELKTTYEQEAHWCVTVKFVTDRGISHEIVRHRPASYSQESTRYVNYGGKDIEVIQPVELTGQKQRREWLETALLACNSYRYLISLGTTPQNARSVLPTCLATTLYMTANLHEYKHFFKMRTAQAAHPDMRRIAIPLQQEFKQEFPKVFDRWADKDEG